MTDTTTYAAGWYADANELGTERYYDGTAWTSQTRPVAAAAPATPAVAEAPVKKAWYKRKGIIIPVAIVGGIILLSTVITAANGGSENVADEKPVTQVEESAVEAEPIVYIDVPNVVGMTGSEAQAALVALGLKGDVGGGDLSMPVTAQDLTPGSQLEEGQTVVLTLQEKPAYTVAQESAIRSATSYLSFKGFSRAGLAQQLTSEYGEGFDPADAEFAIAAIEASGEVDWNQEAVQSAESYLAFKGFSRDGLFEQLTSEYGEQFTPDQANFALDTVGL